MPNNSALNNYADLLRCAKIFGKDALKDVSELLGYAYQPQIADAKSQTRGTDKKPKKLTQPTKDKSNAKKRPPEPFFYVTARQAIASQSGTPDQDARLPSSIQGVKPFTENEPALQIAPDAAEPLAWLDIDPDKHYQQHLAEKMVQAGAKKLDLAQLLKKVSYLQPIHKIPQLRQNIPAMEVTVLLDLNALLLPFWSDFQQLCQIIVQKYPHAHLTIREIDDQPQGPHYNWLDEQQAPQYWSLPPANSVLLILSDLGQLAHDNGAKMMAWQSLGKQLQRQGLKPFVFTPLCSWQQNKALQPYYRQYHWCRGTLSIRTNQSEFKQQLKRILALLSVAVNIEPELLRAICRLLPVAEAHSGIEAAIWSHPDMRRSYTLIQFKDNKRQEYLDLLQQEKDNHLQKQVLQLIQQHHARAFPGVWARELSLAAEVVNFPINEVDKPETARQFFQRLTRTLYQQPQHQSMVLYARRELERLSQQICAEQKQADSPQKFYSVLYALAYQQNLSQQQPLPDWINPQEALAVLAQANTPQPYRLIQHGECLYLLPEYQAIENPLSGSLLAKLDIAQEALWINQCLTPIEQTPDAQASSQFKIIKLKPKQKLEIHTGQEQIMIDTLCKPDWLSAMARNSSGLYREILDKTGQPQRSYWHPPEIDPSSPSNSISQRGIWHPDRPGKIQQPHWASQMGRDQYGLYADFEINGIWQRMRWIEAGHFLIGSPQDEPQRYDDEVQHPVTLSQGFWLADTTVTQALWQQIMPDNPSYFKGEQHPVEQVSWDDTQVFLQKINQRLKVPLTLPGEAQWEYACRAGTQTAFYFGENITTDEVNYNGENPYNQGPKGKYRKQTVAVKSLPINRWGLYEMHGNVWEWCLDYWQKELSAEPVVDPLRTTGKGNRSRRGGSWRNYGRNVRSAFRLHDRPVARDGRTGFRLSLGHELAERSD